MRLSKQKAAEPRSKASYTFVNYSHPSQQHGKEQRFAVQSFVSGRFRRKSRKIVLPQRTHRGWQSTGQLESVTPLTKRSGGDGNDEEMSANALFFSEGVEAYTRLCRPHTRPLNIYPIAANACVSVAINFCSSLFLNIPSTAWIT